MPLLGCMPRAEAREVPTQSAFDDGQDEGADVVE